MSLCNYDHCKTLSISDLRHLGYRDFYENKTGTVSWSLDGNKVASISIALRLGSDGPYLQLSYEYNDTPINYAVKLVWVPSNLGKGVVWYFSCPQTGKRCRKLYAVEKYFLHRDACKGKGGLYYIQTLSHKQRERQRFREQAFGDKVEKAMFTEKYFKPMYAGKSTKRQRKRIAVIEKRSSALRTFNLLLAAQLEQLTAKVENSH